MYTMSTPLRDGPTPTDMTPSIVTSPTPISPVCPKCGTNEKSGKRSCCVRGGAWFSNCGDPGDSEFDHTWNEGRQACQGEAQGHAVMIRNETTIAQQRDTTRQDKGPSAQQQLTDSAAGTDSDSCVELSKIAVFVSLVLILYVQI